MVGYACFLSVGYSLNSATMAIANKWALTKFPHSGTLTCLQFGFSGLQYGTPRRATALRCRWRADTVSAYGSKGPSNSQSVSKRYIGRISYCYYTRTTALQHALRLYSKHVRNSHAAARMSQ